MRLSVRQRWCNLLSETVWPPHHSHHSGRSCTSWRCFSSAPPSAPQSLCRHFSSPAVITASPVSALPAPQQPADTIASPSAHPSPSASPPSSADDLYHQALVLAASAAHLGHPHAVLAVIDSLRQQRHTASLSHPALHNQLLRAHLHCDSVSPNSRYSKMREVWRAMQADRVRCNRQTYALLLNACINKHRQLIHEQRQQSEAAHTQPVSVVPHSAPLPSCLEECLDLVRAVPLSTFVCNLLIKAALLSNKPTYPFRLFQHSFPPLAPNSATLSLLVDAALTAPAATPRDAVNKAMDWYTKVRETSRSAGQQAAVAAAVVAGTPAMYAKLMRRCLQYSDGTQEVQHVPVLFSHMEEAGLRVEAEHIRCLVLALSRLQLRGVGWRVWQEMESARRVQRTDDTDALMLRVMSEEKDYQRAMEVIASIEQRWAAAPPVASSTASSFAVSNYRSALSNIARNGNSATLLALLSHVFSSARYSSSVLRGGMLESVVRRWREAGRSVDELRAKVRQWVAAVDMGEQEMDAWQTLVALLTQRVQRTEDEVDALKLRTLSKGKDHQAAMQLVLSIEQRWAASRLTGDSASSSLPLPLSTSVMAYYRSALYNAAGSGSAVLLLACLSHVLSSRYSQAVLRGGKLEAVVSRWRATGSSVDELQALARQRLAALDRSGQETEGWLALAAILASQSSTGTTALPSLPHAPGEERRQRERLRRLNGSPGGTQQHTDTSASAVVHHADANAGAEQAPGRATVSVITPVVVNSSPQPEVRETYSFFSAPGAAVYASELPVIVGDPENRVLEGVDCRGAVSMTNKC